MGGASAGYGAYYQDPSATGFSPATGMQQNTMGYHQSTTGYGQDARQTPNFPGSYNPNMMYNVPQAGAQSTVYDTPGSSFDLRQPAAQQIMPTDVTNTYFPSEPTNAAAASGMQQQQQPSTAQSAAVYQQGSADTRNTMLNYPSNVAGMGTMATQATSSVPDVSMEESGDYQGNTDLNQAYSQYQDALKEVFSNIKKGALAAAGESLRSVSEWLLSNVNELGMFIYPFWCFSLSPCAHYGALPCNVYACKELAKVTDSDLDQQALPRTIRICTQTESSYGTTSTMHGWVFSKCKRS